MAVMEGGWGFGQIIGLEAFEVAIEKARKTGVGIIAVSRCGHIGRVGHYPYLAAEQGLVTVMFVNTHGGGKLAAPWGGRGRRLSANPISVGIPRKDDEPLVLDMATSAIADGKLKDMLNRGVPAPAGCIVDADGNPTTDPADYVGPPEGALLPFGGHKGFGLSFVIDILAGALSGAGCSRDGVNRIGNGFLAIVIQPGQLRDSDGFFADVAGLVQHVKGSELAAGFDEILAPGEPEIRTRQQRIAGRHRVDDTAWGKICAAAERYGVNLTLSE